MFFKSLFCLLLAISAFGQVSYVNGGLNTESGVNFCADSSSTANVITCANPAGAQISGYYVGQSWLIKIANNVTGATTLSIDGLAATAVKKMSNGSLITLGSGDGVANQLLQIGYDGTQFVLLGGSATSTTSAGGPDTRLQAAFDKFATALYTKQNVVIFGDSLSRCWQGNCPATGPADKPALWVEELKNYLWSRYGYGGTGIIPLDAVITGPGVDTAVYTLTGTNVVQNFFGPASAGNNIQGSLGSIHQFTPGSTITFDMQDVTTVRWYGATGGDNLGWTLTVDGSVVGAAYMTGQGTNTPAIASVAAPGGRGTHHVVLTANAGSGHSYFYGAEGSNPSGIEVHNVSEGGCRADCYGVSVSTSEVFTDLIPGGTALSFVVLGINEALAGSSTSSFQTYEQALITHQLGLGSQVALMNSPYPQSANPAPYFAVNATLASANTIPLYDPATNLFLSYANEVNQSWMNDTIHLNDLGQNKWAVWLIPQIFGANQSVNSYQPVTASGGTGSTFTGGTVANPISITGSFGTTLLSLTNTNAAQYTHLGYIGTGRTFNTGVGNAGAPICPNGYFVYDTVGGLRSCMDSTGTLTLTGGTNTNPLTINSTANSQTSVILSNSNSAAGNSTIHDQYLVTYAGGVGLYDVQATNHPWNYYYGKGLSVSGATMTETSGNNDMHGRLTLTGGTASVTFAASYTAAYCNANDETSNNAVKPAATGTGATFTGTSGDAIVYNCTFAK